MAVLDDYLTPQQRHVEQLSLGDSTPPPPVQLPPYYLAAPGAPSAPPPAPPQVVDRQAYWQEQRQMQEEQQRQRQQAIQQQREAAQQQIAAQLATARRAMAPVTQVFDKADYFDRQSKVNIADYGYDPGNPQTWAAAQAQAKAEARRRADAGITDVQIRYPGQNETPMQGVANVASQFGRAGKAVMDVATTQLPGMDRVANVAEQVGETVGQHAIGALTLPGVEYLPGVSKVSDVAGTVMGKTLESLVPTEVWQAALTLLPAAKARSIPELLSAITIGDKDALTAIKQAGAKLGESATVERGLAALASESGRAKIPGKAAGELPPASLAPVREAFSGKSGRVQVGTRVFATDRNNFGRVVQINPDGTAKVYFKAPRGGEAYVDMPPDVLNPLVSGGRRSGTKIVPLTSAELEQSWELLPARNQKFVGIVAEHSLTETKRAELLTASRSRKAGNIAGIARGEGSADEKLAQMWAARKGADLPEQPALREFFDDEDIAGYQQDVIDAIQSGLITPHEGTNAGSILRLIMDGARKDGTKTPITQGERSLMGKIFGPELEKVLPTTPEKMSLLQKFLAPLHIWRSSKTAFDFGAMFRQGRKVIVSDFREWAHSSRTQLRALGQQGYDRVQEVVHASPYYSLGQSTERPLGIMEQGGGLSDEFLSPLTKPTTGAGIKKRINDVVLAPVRASERTYNAFLNTLRQGIFDKNMDELVAHFGTLEQVPMSEVQRIIDNINNATMFGNISALGDYSKAMSQTLFSVRSLVSGPQFYADFVRANGPNASPAARRIINRRFASVIASDLATLGSIAAVGAYLKAEGSPVPVGVNMDPYSQAFGNVQIGPVKWNIWGPEAQIVRATVQAATGKRRPEGAIETKDLNAFDRVTGYGRTKLSPSASVFYDLFLNKQRDFQGRPIKDRAWQYAVEQASPIMGYSMYDSFREEGFWGLAEAGQGVGLDTQVYGPSKTVAKDNIKTAAAKPIIDAGFADIVPDTWKDNLTALSAAIPADQLSKPLAQFSSLAEMKADYLAPAPGEHPTKTQVDARATRFDALPAVKAYKQMIKDREVYILRKVPPAQRQAAYDAGVIDIDADQRKALGIK